MGDFSMESYERTMEKKEIIENTLLEMMQQLPYEQISVMQIVQRLGVSRRTFYRNFPSKDACFCSLTDRIIQNLYLKMHDSHPHAQSMYQVYFAYWYKNQDFLRCVLRNNLKDVFANRFCHHARTEERVFLQRISSPIAGCDEDILQFYSQGTVAILINWARRDFDTSVENMARKMERVIYRPLID